jgi:hypothetical protein
MRTTLLITLLFYIGTWALVLGFPEISAQYPGGAWYLTGALTVGAFLGCVFMDIRHWWQQRK